MHYRRLFTGILVSMVLTLSGLAENKYTGVKMCGACHKAEKNGAAFVAWEKSPHAKAFEVLKSKEADEIAKKKGLKKPASESPECLKCHVTGGGSAAGAVKEEGVTCEGCHGAASGFLMVHNKKDEASKKKAKDAGLVLSDDNGKLCETCHNKQSPTFKGFVYKEMLAKIAHPRVGLNYDAGNTISHRPGTDCAADALAAMPYCVHTHVKDVRADANGYFFTTLGDGQIDCGRIVQAIAGTGLDLSIEIPMRGSVGISTAFRSNVSRIWSRPK